MNTIETLSASLRNVNTRLVEATIGLRAAQATIKLWRVVAGVCFVVAMLVAAIGCTLQPVPVHLVDERAEPAGGRALVDEACEMLALECYFAKPGRGVVEIRIVDDAGEGIRGKTEGVNGCRRALRAEPYASTIAHELGHVFWLDDDHVDETSIMFEPANERDDDASLDVEQLDTVHANAARFTGGC